MKKAGYECKRINDAGYSAFEATGAGYTVAQMFTAGYVRVHGANPRVGILGMEPCC